jgi:hypothetical protein
MVTPVACGTVRVVAVCVNRNGNRERRGIPQIGGRHQHEWRGDAERKERIERRQDSAEIPG